jgi:light-dependent protochlorophyllide reductase
MQQTAIITGGSRGLGLATARELVRAGWHVVLACRDVAAGERARASLGAGERVEVAPLDLADLDSVRAFAAGVRDPVAALVCNAATQLVGRVETTAAGLEMTFATNHLAHFLLARLLLPVGVGRIAIVASNTHDPARFTGMPAPDLGDLDGFARGRAFAGEPVAAAGRRRYTTSKLCNVLCAYELQRRIDASGAATAVTAFDPGLMPGTGLARDYGALARLAWRFVLPALALAPINVNTVATSARRLARVAATPDPSAWRGAYMSCGRETASSAASHDRGLALALWNTSSDLCGLPRDLDHATQAARLVSSR